MTADYSGSLPNILQLATTWVVQLTGFSRTDIEIFFFDWVMSFFQRFDNRERTVCKICQNNRTEFIRLHVGKQHNFPVADNVCVRTW